VEVGALLPTLYLHRLALGNFDLALRGLLGDAAPLSPASLLLADVVQVALHTSGRAIEMPKGMLPSPAGAAGQRQDLFIGTTMSCTWPQSYYAGKT
jgi:hypothetical protein